MALIVMFVPLGQALAGRGLVHAAAASLGIFVTAFLFCELHLIGIVLLTLVKVRSRVRTADLATKGTAGLNGAVHIAAGSALAGFVCWLVDRLFCARLLALAFNPQLHAVWHLACGVALYRPLRSQVPLVAIQFFHASARALTALLRTWHTAAITVRSNHCSRTHSSRSRSRSRLPLLNRGLAGLHYPARSRPRHEAEGRGGGERAASGPAA
jgi:hypothetical protein